MTHTHLPVADLLPVVCDAKAKISPRSSLKSIGKVPSLFDANGMVVGIRDWTSHQATPEEVAQWVGTPGMGLCLQTRDVRAIDIDIDDEEKADSVEALVTLMLGSLPVRRRAGSGRRVLLLRVAGPLRKRRVTVDGGIVELLGDGNQVVVSGIHVASGQPLVIDWRDGVPTVPVEDLNALWAALGGTVGDERVAMVAGAAVEEVGPGTVADLRSALSALDCTDYDTWIRAGSALRGLGEQGWELWSEWSAGDDRWSVDEGMEKWRGFGHDSIRYVTVFTMASAAGWVNPGMGGGPASVDEFESVAVAPEAVSRREVALEYWIGRIMAAGSATQLRDSICKGIVSDQRIDNVARDTLAHRIAASLRAMGQPVGIGVVRDLLKPDRRVVVADTKEPRWSDGWCYVTAHDKLIHLDTKHTVTPQGFRALNGRYLSDEERAAAGLAGVAPDPIRIALDLHHIPVASHWRYAPGLGPTFEFEGLPSVNTFRPASVPEAALPNGSEEVVIRHIQLLVGERDASVFIQWMAHNVQHMGGKIRWAPLIKGVEGDGKSLLGGLMASVLGAENVTVASPSAVRSEFNNWAEGHCLAILEEVREVGHNRHDVLNRLKPLITNDVISVHPKGVGEYITPNTQNYIAFTNHDDALPLSDGDRRWFVLRSRFETKEDLARVMDADYFRTLHHTIQQNVAALRGWLLSVDLTGFDADGRAPETEAKALMREMTRPEGDDELEDALAEGGYGYNKDIATVKHLRAALPGVWKSDRQVSAALVRAGFKQYVGSGGTRGPVYMNGKLYRVYLRQEKSHEEAVALLRAALSQ